MTSLSKRVSAAVMNVKCYVVICCSVIFPGRQFSAKFPHAQAPNCHLGKIY